MDPVESLSIQKAPEQMSAEAQAYDQPLGTQTDPVLEQQKLEEVAIESVLNDLKLLIELAVGKYKNLPKSKKAAMTQKALGDMQNRVNQCPGAFSSESKAEIKKIETTGSVNIEQLADLIETIFADVEHKKNPVSEIVQAVVQHICEAIDKAHQIELIKQPQHTLNTDPLK